MQRINSIPRADWQKKVESQGFYFHTPDGQPYWDESAYYHFTRTEVDALEKATYALNEMCLAAVQHVVDNGRLEEFQVPAAFAGFVAESWEKDEITICGRFDLAWDGRSPPKLLEYNADTPTSLLEAAVVQWFWMKELHGNLDQFNSIHERLIEAWGRVKASAEGPVHFTALRGNIEDYMTVNYLRDTAMQAGLDTFYLDIEAVGWNAAAREFRDEAERRIRTCFKLYPWEWLVQEPFAPHLLEDATAWLEAPWKMILSNKAILAVLWELYPNSPFLLPSAMQPVGENYVCKPMLGREGANIQVVRQGKVVLETEGEYGGPWVYQQLYPLPQFEGNYPVIGSWMVNGYACGIGIREDRTPVTQNTSRFLPHVFQP